MSLIAVGPLDSCSDHHLTAALLLSDTVLDGVFDERLEQRAAAGGTREAARHVDRDAQAMLEAGTLDVEVRFDHFEFSSERGEFAFRSGTPRSSDVKRNSVSNARGGAV